MGTKGKVKASLLQLDNKYSSSNPSSVSAFRVPNSFDTRLEFEVAQPLLQGWKNSEIRLQKMIINGEKIEPHYKRKSLVQSISYEMENFFIHYSVLEKQVQVLKSMRKDLKQVVQLIKKQKKIGRAEELDVIKAEYKIISFDMRLQNLETELENLRKKILLKCGFDTNSSSITIQTLNPGKFSLEDRISSYATAYPLALKNNYELKRLKKLEDPIFTEVKLLKEKDRPSLDLFVNYGVNGKKSDFDESFKEMVGIDHPKVTFGFNFSYTFGADTFRSEYAGLMSQVDSLDYQRKSVLEGLQRDLELAFYELKMLDKKVSLNKRKIDLLNRQYQYEKLKFKQAREEKISLVLTQIEVKEVSLETINLQKDKLLIGAKLRHLTHSYQLK